MIKNIAFTIIIGSFLIITIIPAASSSIKELRETGAIFDGDTLYVGGSGPGNYTTIQSAIDDASDGDTVFVYSGTYYESINISTSIQLIGENKNSTIIDNLANFYHVIAMMANNVSINSFSLKNNGTSGYPTYSYCGIVLYNSSNCIISNNILSGMERGIVISLSSYDNIIRENTLSEMVLAGIYITHESKGNIVDNNRIVDTWFGICNRKASDHNIFINNDISLCESIGILVSESSNTEISNNNLFSNTEGIRVYESDNSKIESNIIEENQIGLSLSYAKNYEINRNNFLNNEKHATFTTLIRDFPTDNHEWNANYWDNLRILPYVIRGNIRIFIPWINFDWHPSLRPYNIS